MLITVIPFRTFWVRGHSSYVGTLQARKAQAYSIGHWQIVKQIQLCIMLSAILKSTHQCNCTWPETVTYCCFG